MNPMEKPPKRCHYDLLNKIPMKRIRWAKRIFTAIA